MFEVAYQQEARIIRFHFGRDRFKGHLGTNARDITKRDADEKVHVGPEEKGETLTNQPYPGLIDYGNIWINVFFFRRSIHCFSRRARSWLKRSFSISTRTSLSVLTWAGLDSSSKIT